MYSIIGNFGFRASGLGYRVWGLGRRVFGVVVIIVQVWVGI